MGHSLDLNESNFVDIEVIPEVVEVKSKIFLKILTGKLFILSNEFCSDLEASLLVHPVLSHFWLMEMAAFAITATLLGALIFLLTLGLKIEAATAIASTVRIIAGLKDILLQNESMAIEDESVHKFVITIGEISNINLRFWYTEVLFSIGSDTCDHSRHG